MFVGFGVLAHYNNKNVTYKFKYKCDEEISEELSISFQDADKDPEKRWHTINLKEEFGIKPIRVDEGGKIDIMIKVGDDDMRRCYYGTGGYKEKYSTLPD
jgi:hypothetical protein